MRADLRPAWMGLGILALLAGPELATANDPVSAAYCAKAGDDDALHPPPPGTLPALRRAYTRLLGGSPLDDDFLRTNAQVRCMDGKLLVCFVGANLPCGKIDTARDNTGAAAWCKEHPGDKIIPLAATGHDTLYTYECDGRAARVTGTNWTLDRRGFATKLWTPLE